MFDEQVVQEGIKALGERLGGREGANFHMLFLCSMSQQPTDITFFKAKPKLDVKVSPKLAAMMTAGAGKTALSEFLNAIPLSDGTTIFFKDIWTICPMPPEGFTEEQLAKVDLSRADQRVGMGGETMRKIIRDTYHCETQEEEEKFLRRFLAS